MSPRGRDIVARLREAADTVARLRADPYLRPAGYRSAMPRYIRDAAESYGYGAAAPRPAIPTPREIDRMDEAFGWLPSISDEAQRRLVLARAFRVRWAALRPRFGMLSIRRLRQLHDKGIAEIVLALDRSPRG